MEDLLEKRKKLLDEIKEADGSFWAAVKRQNQILDQLEKINAQINTYDDGGLSEPKPKGENG